MQTAVANPSSDTAAAPSSDTAAARLWSMRATAELEAAARFERLAHDLTLLEAEPVVQALARAAAVDEHRHHRRCVALVERFGGRWQAPASPPRAPALSSGVGRHRADVLYELVAMSCITETLSAALLVEMRSAATDPEVRAVVHEILTDEVDHSRLGWAHLAAEARDLDCRFLGRWLPAMLSATVRDELFHEDDAPSDAALDGVGGLSRTHRRDIFAATMQDVVFPGLRRFGVPTDEAERWLDRRLPEVA